MTSPHSARRYLITGGTSGIGYALARLLAREGASLALVARSGDRLEAVIAELPGGPHLFQAFDLADGAGIPRMVGQLSKALGGLHGLAHCAGLHRSSPLRTLNPDALADLFAVNVTAGAMLAKGFRSRLVRQPSASIVLLSSAVGLVGDSGVSGYAASKGAVITLAKSLALELASEDVRVNAVCPGVVDTPMTRQLKADIGEEAFAELAARHPLGLGTPEDVAEAIAFLLSLKSRWVTGSALVVDGGYTAQ